MLWPHVSEIVVQENGVSLVLLCLHFCPAKEKIRPPAHLETCRKQSSFCALPLTARRPRLSEEQTWKALHGCLLRKSLPVPDLGMMASHARLRKRGDPTKRLCSSPGTNGLEAAEVVCQPGLLGAVTGQAERRETGEQMDGRTEQTKINNASPSHPPLPLKISSPLSLRDWKRGRLKAPQKDFFTQYCT